MLLLVVAVAAVYLAVRWALARADEHRVSVAAASTLALLAVLPELLGRAFSSLPVGLALTGATCAIPAALEVRARRARTATLPATSRSRVEWSALVAIVVLGSWTALSTYLWDEGSTHFGVSAAIARGVLPPEHPLFPGAPFAYHYGYDVLVALFARATGLSLAWCCDVVTIACLVVVALALADVGRVLGGARGAWLAVLVVPLGYGPAAGLLADGWGAALPGTSLFPQAWVSAQRLPPPVISSFFQHPQGLGMPIALAAVLLAAGGPPAPEKAARRARWVGAAALLALLASAQTVFFLLTGVALGVMVVVDAGLRRDARALAHLGALALAGVAGVMLAPLLQRGSGDALEVGGYFADAPGALMWRHVLLFGGSVLAVPVTLVRPSARRSPLRAGLMAAAAAGFVVANTVSYARSWDVVKFFAVGAFFGNLLLADLLAMPVARAWQRVAVAVVLLASTWSATFWLVRHGPLNGVVAARYTEAGPDPIGVALVARHGTEIPARAHVLTTHTDIHQAGVLVEGADWRRGGTGYRLDRDAQDRAHARAQRALRTMQPADLRATGAHFLLLRTEAPPGAPLTKLGEVQGFSLYRVEPAP